MGNLRFPPRGPSLQPPPESPFPFRVERLPVRPASSCSNKSFAFGTLGLVGTGSHGGARPSPTSCRHPSRRTARPRVWGFSGRARTPAIPPTAGRGYARRAPLVVISYRPPTGIPRPEGIGGKSWKEGDKAEAVVPKGSGRRSIKREGLRACGGLPNKPWRRPTFPHKSMQYHGR